MDRYEQLFLWVRHPAGVIVVAAPDGRRVLLPQGPGQRYLVTDSAAVLGEFLQLGAVLGAGEDERAASYAEWSAKHGPLNQKMTEDRPVLRRPGDADRCSLWDENVSDLIVFSGLATALDQREKKQVVDIANRHASGAGHFRMLVHEKSLDPRLEGLSTSKVLDRARVLMRDLWAEASRDHLQLSLDAFKINNMLGLLWLAARQQVHEGPPARVCRNCALPFWPSKSSRGGRDKYCGNRCRQATHRTRTKALRLWRAGKKPRAIAKGLGIEARIVSEWIASAKKKKDAESDSQVRSAGSNNEVKET